MFTIISRSIPPLALHTYGSIDSKTRVFTIQEYGQRMSPQSAASLCNLVVRQSDFQPADLGPISLENALLDMENNSTISKCLVSDSVTAGNIIMRYTDDRTLSRSFNEFKTRLGDIVELEVNDFTASVHSELESFSKFARFVSSQRIHQHRHD